MSFSSTNSSSPPKFNWIYAHLGAIPRNAIQGGIDKNGRQLFIGRQVYNHFISNRVKINGAVLIIISGWYNNVLYVGKLSAKFKGLLIGCNGKELKLDDYYVLCGEASYLRWVPHTTLLNDPQSQWHLVEGAKSQDDSGQHLRYIARINYKNTLQVGQTGDDYKQSASFTYNGKEINSDTYDVLVFL
ncbi:hypothetical protein BDF19DRAFT_426444 [Syncephalis fuscata]|nr:hypothetical protein BDF19DRAFT_426444 [Syncephalis fuscata]